MVLRYTYGGSITRNRFLLKSKGGIVAMENDEIEKKIQKAYHQITPDALEGIMRELESDGKESNVYKKRTKRKFGVMKILSVAAAAAVAVIGVSVGATHFNGTSVVASTVSIDVNPALEIKVNKDQKVLSVIPKNDDAKEIIGNMDFSNTDVRVVVNAILGSMITKGYISELANSILVSVDDADPETAKVLQDKLMEDINKTISGGSFDGAVLGQVITNDEEMDTVAAEYGITASKAQLIKQITDQNPTLKFDDLVSLSINDLNLLKKDTKGISSIGVASEAAYIGSEEAVRIALVNANIDKVDTEFLKVDFDYENGVICYDVSFHKNEEDLNYDYDYNIDALTGEMISFEKELDNPEVLVVSENMQLKKTEEEARAEAFKFAGKNEADIFAYEIEVDEKKVPHYDVEFKSEGMEYNYSVGLYHDVLFKMKWEKEEGGLTDKMYEPSEEEKLKFIGEEKAKQIAMQKAGVLEGELYGLEVEIEKDRKGIVYEVEFKSGIYSYSYDVDSVTGEIVDYEIDYSNK